MRKEENGRTQEKKKPIARMRTNKKLNPLAIPGPGFEPRPHWLEASALTTAPPLLPKDIGSYKMVKGERGNNLWWTIASSQRRVAIFTVIFWFFWRNHWINHWNRDLFCLGVCGDLILTNTDLPCVRLASQIRRSYNTPDCLDATKSTLKGWKF